MGRDLETAFADAPIGRDRDQFLREFVRELSGTLERVVGIDQAAGFMSTVGGRIGRLMNEEYRSHAGCAQMNREQVAAALVDLKRRIEGGFSVTSITDDAIVLQNRVCPFGDQVRGRPSLCMMTSNIFGKIAAENLGYARVELAETIAAGDGGCRVIIHLEPVEGAEIDVGREYFAEEG
ncbi:MAG: methanogen output domain 1-containing protein [Minwuia sp.]|uniref:methanogen output domain 1-containing protein n=1 Tax=Minwuia sp. TaxID=2493630 RepID=UPI003A85291B